MKKNKIGPTDTGRRSRIDMALSEQEDSDPVAAAVQAKKAREEARIKAAAAAAAKAFAGKSKTVFFDTQGASPAAPAAIRTSPASSSSEISSNPLASILGYDNDSASEDGSEPPSPRAATAASPRATDDAVVTSVEAGKATGEEDDPMLASFMSELESSGLLEREAAPSPDADAKADPQLATTSEPNLAAAIVDAVNDDTAAVPQQQDLSDLPEQAAAVLANADATPTEPAEQRVLGDLEGAPTWREVMDMASGKVYFWEQDTDEVAWEPPPGGKPRSKQDNAVTFAAHSFTADTLRSDAAPDAAPETAAAHLDANGDAEAQAVDNAHHRQQASTSQGSSDQTDRPSAGEEDEDGQLEEVASAQPSVSASMAGTVQVPDAHIGVSGQQTCDQLRQATHRLCRNVPRLVRLAVEAEIRMQDWQMFSSKQQRAVDQSLPHAALSWTDFQDHMQWRWQSIQAAVPGALSEAEKLQRRMEQDLEDGEMPPLPSEEALPPTSGMPDAQAAVRGDPALAQQAPASAVGTPPPGLNEPSHSTNAPPLPVEEPPSAAATTSASTAAAGQPAAAAGNAAAAGGAAAAVDDDTDMELDMEVDPETSPEASRPASAEAAGTGAAGTSGSLPNWAGFYMAHGYTYPYYGQATASTSQPPSTDPTAPPTSHAADFLSNRLAKDPSPPPQPAVQAPAAVKKKQYQAEPAPAPAPAVNSDGAAESDEGAPAADAVVSAWSAAEKQAQEAEARKRKRPKAPVGPGQLAAKKKKGTKGVSGLIDKWQAVRKDLEEQEAKAEEEQFPDAAAQERKRTEEAEKWRLQQLKAGAASEENANFQPLAVDWREKLKATRKGSKKGSSTSSSPDPASSAAQPQPADSSSDSAQAAELAMTADGKPNLELLSQGLPAGWRAMWDKNTGDIYYGNLKSRVRFCLTHSDQGSYSDVPVRSVAVARGMAEVASSLCSFVTFITVRLSCA